MKYLSHDGLFKTAMQNIDIARDLITAHLPKDILAKLNLDNLHICKETYIDKQLQKSMTDVLLQTSTKEGDAFVYLLTEHASSPKREIPLQVMRYVLGIAETYIRHHQTDDVPLIIPLVLYQGKTAYPYSHNWFDCFGKNRAQAENLLLHGIHFIDLSQVADNSLLQHKKAGILEWCFKHAHERSLLQHTKILARLLQQAELQKNLGLLDQFMYYLLYNMDDEQHRQFLQGLSKNLNRFEGDNIMSSIAERLINDGKAIGMKQGYHAGHNEGSEQQQRKVALRMLTMGLSPKLIHEATELSFEAIDSLAAAVERA